MKAFISQYFYWAFSHALYEPPRYVGNYLAIFTFCPVVWFLIAFARKVPVSWKATSGLFLVPILLSPVAHYFIPALPFLCLITAIGLKRIREKCAIDEKFMVYAAAGLLAIAPIGRIGADLIRPWRSHPYGIMDNYFYAGQIPKMEINPPIWTNWPALYFILGWPVPVHDFINAGQIDMGREIDWSQEPYASVNTRIELLSDLSELGSKRHPMYVAGWKREDIFLTRGQFKLMRVWTRIW